MQGLSTIIRKLKQCYVSSLKAAIVLMGIVVCLLFVNTFILKIVVVNGSSMFPTFENGQMVLIKPKEKDIRYGDIVVFDAKNIPDARGFWIKRVIGIGGDVVVINYEDNTVTVNGELLSEPYINQKDDDPMQKITDIESETYVVPDDSFFVMGDNRNHSTDSRCQEVGSVPKEWIIGKVISAPYQK